MARQPVPSAKKLANLAHEVQKLLPRLSDPAKDFVRKQFTALCIAHPA